MRFRAPWLLLGSAVTSAACGLSTMGLSSGPSGAEDASDAVDATSSGEGSTSEDGAADASAQRPDGHGGDPHPGQDAAGDDSADDGGATDAAGDSAHHPEAGDASDAGSAADSASKTDAGDAGTYPGDAGCAGSPGCVTVPSGWSLVAFAPSQATACPTGFETPSNLVEGPNATGACGCGACSLTGQPSCASGAVGVFYDTITAGGGAGTCGMPALTPQLTNNPPGACGNANDGGVYSGDYELFDIEYIPPPASGGACSAPGAANGSVTYAAHDRSCAPVSAQAAGCVGNTCSPGLAAPYEACIMQSGSVSCPAGPLSVQHLAGSGVSFGCSACGCNVSATCTGTITLYTDTKCKNEGVAIPADGTCNRIVSLPHDSTSYTFSSYTYAANPPASVGCSASGSSTAENVALAGPVTICCAP